MSKINWEEKKKEFLLGDFKSVREFADKTGMSYNGHFMQKTKGWADEKNKFEKDKAAEIVQKTVEKQVQNEVDRNVEHLNTWDKILNLIQKIMAEPETYLVKGDGAVNISLVEKVSCILERVQKGQRWALGLDEKGHNDEGTLLDLIRAIKESDSNG